MLMRPVSSGWRKASSAARLNSGIMLHNAVELRQLVQKQDAVMGQGDFPGTGAQPAADQRCQRGRVMRIAEGPLAQQPAAAQTARDRLDHAEFQGLGGFE